LKQFYHLFANGDDARDFITSEEDFRVAFNRFGVCACKCPGLKILAFSIEESHPHCLVYGEFDECVEFKRSYESLTYSYIIHTRGGKDGVIFDLEISEVKDKDYLLNVAAYVLVQPTKDGKQIMPYDYYWGTASMYFRPVGVPSIWSYDRDWNPAVSVEYATLTYKEKRALRHSVVELPPQWLVCNGLILPQNYVDVGMFESIYGTCNRFRVYMSAGKSHLRPVIDGMSLARGISMHDLEARQLARSVSFRMFGKKDSRWLSQPQRLLLAKELRNSHHLTIRQIATLSRLPELEIRKYIR